MSTIFKATGFMLALYVYHTLIHVTGGVHEKRFILEQTGETLAANMVMESATAGSPLLTKPTQLHNKHKIGKGFVLNLDPWHNLNGHNNNKSNTGNTGPTVYETPFQGCAMYTEYNDLRSLKRAQECHTIDYALTTLHALHKYPHGTECIRGLIKELEVFFAQSDLASNDCQCTGYVAYSINRTQHSNLTTCTRQDRMSAEAYNFLFQNGGSVGPCARHNLMWNLISSVSTNLFGLLDCQWEIVKHFNGILDIRDSQCTCTNVPAAVSVAPTLTTTTSILAMPSCNKTATISSLLHRMQFHHPHAVSCGTTNDHRGPDALLLNLCHTNNHTSQWKEGPNVMSNCPSIPLYTPIATFSRGAYSGNGGISGIFLGCLPDGFKIAVQECGSNVTILNLGHGGMFTHDPNAYFVVRE